MSSVKLKATDTDKTKPYPVEVAVKLLKKKPNLYKLNDDKFELKSGELRKLSNKGTDKTTAS